MKNKLLPLLTLLAAAACSTGGSSSSQGNTLSGAEGSSSSAKAPSPLDPAKPPRVTLKGVTDGDLVVSAIPDLEIEVQGYPMEKGWQEAVVLLNRNVVDRFSEGKRTLNLRSGFVEGLNQIVVYLQRSWGESIKGAEASVAVSFFYGKKDSAVARDMGSSLILNSPRGTYTGDAAKKIMFDFLVLQGGVRKYRVYYSIAGELREVPADGAPFYFYNLPAGSHHLKVEMVDVRGKPVRTPFSTAESAFKIE